MDTAQISTLKLSDHAQWQAEHYSVHKPLSPFESYLRKTGFSIVTRPKDLYTKRYFEKMSLTPGSSVLDLGCASGLLLARLRKSFATNGTGIDVSEVLIEDAKAQDSENTYLLGDASQLPFRDGTFDVVSSFDNLEHIKEYKAVIKEIARVLKPGGYVLLNTINRNNKYTIDWLLEKFGSTYHLRRAGHVKELFFHPPDIAQLFRDEGIEIREVKLVDAPFILLSDCILYVFLLLVEFITKKVPYTGFLMSLSLGLTTLLSHIFLPICEKIDTLFTRRGYSNAFFIYGVKS